MRRSLLVLVFALLAGVLWFHPTPTAEAQGCVRYTAPFQGYLYGYCYAYPFNGFVFPVNVPFGGNAIAFGFDTLNVPLFPSNFPFSAFTFGFPYVGYPPYTGFGSTPGGVSGSGGTAGGGSAGGLAYQGFGFPFSGYPFSAGATVTYNGYLFPIFGIPGSVGYNAGSRRGFNPWSTPDAYLKTLDAVALPEGGYRLYWTTGTSFSGTSHEIFQCPEVDTPLVACRSLAVVNSEIRTYGPVPGGYTYVVRSSGYGGNTGTIGWAGGLEASSSRLPLPLTPGDTSPQYAPPSGP
ncbi:MAG TPA: hypothetical protein VFB73_06775 [Chloroflexota bacterium]|nr:hypothetical protein [Chloroflexota bacterium]